jgi:hypothetical protein
MPQQQIDFSQITEDINDISSAGSYRPSSLDVSNVSLGATKNTMSNSKHSWSSLHNLAEESSWTSDFQRGCMIVRTHEESINEEEYDISKRIYRINLQKRLESQIPSVDPVDSSDGAGTSSSESLSVSFHYSEFKMYPMTLGENPAAVEGPPMSIEWEPCASHMWNVDDYEEAKEKNNACRSLPQMRMPADYRTSMLQEAGFSKSELIASKRLMSKLRIERAETRRLLYQTSSQERVEKIRRGLKNLLLSGKKREERQFLAMSKEIHNAQQREVNEVARERRNRKLISLQHDSKEE